MDADGDCVPEVPPLFWRLLILVHWIGEGVEDVTAKQVPAGIPGSGATAVSDSEGRTIAEVARELGVGAQTFRKWVRQDAADRGEAPEKPTSAELAPLKRENVELRRTNEILRLASSFSTRRPTRPGGGREICPGPPRRVWGGVVVSGAGDAGVDVL